MSIQGAARADRLNSVEIGDHILAIYQNKEDEFSEAFQYLKDGLEKDETVMIITNHLSYDEILRRMEKEWKINAEEFEKNGIIEIRTTNQWFFHHGFPDPNKFIPCWFAVTKMALMKRRKGCRVFVDTARFFEQGYSNEFISYESALDNKFNIPLTLLCAYQFKDIQRFTKQQLGALHRHHNVVWV